MALTKNGKYYKIVFTPTSFILDKARCMLGEYASQEARNANIKAYKPFKMFSREAGDYTRADWYAYIKVQPEFQGAKDLL